MNKNLVVPKRELLPKVVELLNLIANHDSSCSGKDIYRECLKPPDCKYFNVTKDFSAILKKCLISCRMDASMTILDVLCQELNMFDLFFFKAASMVLENNPLTSGEDFFYFTRHVKFLKVLNKREIALEYLMYLLRHKDLDGKNNLQLLIAEHRPGLMKNFIIDPLLKAYMGIFDYIEWAKKCKMCEDPDDVSGKTAGEKAISCFKEAIEVPGQWDIFVLKLVEMLEFYENFDEAEAVLDKYVRMNPEHINCYVYLCSFLHRHDRNAVKLITTLKILAERSPSNSLVLLLVEKFIDCNKKKAWNYLFMYLDYPSNTDCTKAWDILSKSIIKALQRSSLSILKELKTLWAQRCDFWLHIHFNVGKLKLDEQDSNLLSQKALVLSAFEKSDHPYIVAVLEIMMAESSNLYEQLKQQIDVTSKKSKRMPR